MLNFFKRKQTDTQVEEIPVKTTENFIAEHNYRIQHDEKYRKSIEKSRAFFQADRVANEKAELVNKIGTYTFICPNCGSQCKGEWVHFDCFGNLHGHTGCYNCNIHLMV